MKIIVEIHEGEDGRPAGSVRSSDSRTARSFSGNLEFLALVEQLYQVDDTARPDTTDTTGGQ